MKTVLKYPGAKNRIASWICNYIPEHEVYVEAFAGSAAVLLNKERSHIETLNDLDGDIVNFFRVLRDHPEGLQRLIKLTPFARDEYKAAFETTENQIEMARRYCIKCWQGFGNSQLYNNGFKSGQQSTSPNPARAWADLPETIKLVANRLRGVQVENLPAVEILNRYDTPDVFLYLDPPYLPETRKSHLYKHEMSTEEHEKLLMAVTKHKGKILISGYESDMYNSALKGWRKAYKDTTAEGGLKRKEVIWMNYDDGQMNIKDFL